MIKYIIASFLFVIISSPANATIITVGNQSNGDCTFGCIELMQQVYAGSNFGTSPVEITSVGLFQFAPSPSQTSGTFDMYLSTSANPLGSLSSTFANNRGADAQYFGSVTLSGSAVDQALVEFFGSFIFDPTAGDLLIEFDRTSASGNGNFWAANNGEVGRVYSFSDGATSGSVNQSYGLQTRFEYTAAVPEPSILALMGLGLAGMGFARRRKAA